MVLVCESCGSLRDLSPGVLGRIDVGEDGRLRCPDCGEYTARAVTARDRPSISDTSRPPPAQRAPIPPPIQDLDDRHLDGEGTHWVGRSLLLRREGRVYRLRDLDRVRRLVVERRARGTDLLSADGVRWEPLVNIPALAPYLAVVEHLAEEPSSRVGGLVDATAAQLGWHAVPDDLPTEEVAMDEVPALPSPPATPSTETDHE